MTSPSHTPPNMISPVGSLGYACSKYGISYLEAESNVNCGSACPTCFLNWDDCACDGGAEGDVFEDLI